MSLILVIYSSSPAFAVTTSNTLVLCIGGGSSFDPEEFTTSGFLTKFLQIDYSVDYNCNGLSQDPTDGTWYAIIEDREVGRELVTFVPSTDHWIPQFGEGTGTPYTIVGSLGIIGEEDYYNSLAFNSTGTLFSTTAKSHTEPNILSIVDKTTGLATPQCTLPVGDDDRHNVFYNYNDDHLYVQSHFGDPDPTGQKLYKITDVSGAVCSVTEIVKPTQATVFPLGVETMGTAHNTNDNLIYTQGTYENGTGTWYNPYYTISLEGALNVLQETIQPTESFNQQCNPFFNEPVGNFTVSPCPPFVERFTLKGFAFELNLGSSDTTPPVISAIDSEPITLIQDSSFDAFEHVQCIDDVDGEIVPNGTFEVEETQGVTIDTSVRGTQIQNYYCKDSADNDVSTDIQYIIKKKSTGGGSGSSSGGTTSSTPSLSSIPTLSVQDSPTQGDEGTSIADLFANLFDNRITEGITTPTQSQGSNPLDASGDSSQRPNPIADFFQNLFADFFG